MKGLGQLILLFALTVGMLAATQQAHAGTYVVRSCWGSSEIDGWTSLEKIPGAYTSRECSPGLNPTYAPWFGSPGAFGMYAAVWPLPGAWPFGSGSGWEFAAPENTRIVGLSAEVSSLAGLRSVSLSRPIFRGFWNADNPGQRWPFPLNAWNQLDLKNISLQRVGMGVRCMELACSFDGWNAPDGPERADYQHFAQARNITMTLQDDAPPHLEVVGSPERRWTHAPSTHLDVLASDNVGVTGLISRVDGKLGSTSENRCAVSDTNTLVRPCPASSRLGRQIDLTTLDEGLHDVTVRAVDPSDNVTQRTFRIGIDRTAPGSPRALQLVGGSSWRSTNGFTLRWANPPDTQGAEIDRADYVLCPAANEPWDERGCVSGRREGTGIAEITDLPVPEPGAWRLRLALGDAAGNGDPDRSATVETLRFDGEAPQAAFLPVDPANPTAIPVRASDDISGVSTVEVEARREGDAVWRALAVDRTASGYAATLDDERLATGTYVLRARVVDAAGNERTTNKLSNGMHMEVALPLRAATSLVAGRPARVKVRSAKGKRPRFRRVLVDDPRANYGEVITIEGKLADPDGNARREEDVRVLERVGLPGQEWRMLATVLTDRSGVFRFRAEPGPARVLRFEYLGTATSRPSSEEVEVRVRAGVTLRPDRRRLNNGDEVIFRGKLRGGPYPQAGKLIALQARTSRGWMTFATPRARAKDGRFASRYRFVGTSMTTRYVFRAVVPRDSGYPYATGTSKLTTVVVRGDG